MKELKSILLLKVQPLPRNTKHMAIDGQVCFRVWPFAFPVKSLRCTTGWLGLVNGINKDVSGARLLSITVSTCPVAWVCFFHFLKTQNCCLCPNGRYRLLSDTHLPPPPTPPIPYNVPSVILQSLWKRCSKSESVS